MKKRLMTCLVVTLLTIALLTGCGRSEVRKTAEGFLQGIMDGDVDAVSVYATEELMNSGTLVFADREELKAQLYEQLGVSEEDLSEEAIASVDNYVDIIVQNVIKEYEITSVSVKKRVGTVKADIVKGYDPDEEIDLMDEEELLDDIAVYQSEHFDELVEIYTKSGEEAMRREMYNGMVPIVLDGMAQRLEEMDDIQQTTTITVEKIDKQWKVTGFDEVSVPVESAESSETAETGESVAQ